MLAGADIVINNAGVGLIAPVDKLSTEDAHWLMNINFWGVVHGCRHFLPQLRGRPDALLVNISSIFAMVSMPTQSIYNASKAAVRGFSDALREELRADGIDVLCVHPGGIQTNIANASRVVDVTMVADSETSPARYLQPSRPHHARPSRSSHHQRDRGAQDPRLDWRRCQAARRPLPPGPQPGDPLVQRTGPTPARPRPSPIRRLNRIGMTPSMHRPL